MLGVLFVLEYYHMNKDELDLLKKVEELTSRLNDLFGQKSRPLLTRYPLVFTLLVIFGAIMISEGMRGILAEVVFFQIHPLVMLGIGILILILTGTLYKKLKNKE